MPTTRRARRSKPWRVVGHTAEVALELSGRTWAAFYRNAALGFLEVVKASGKPAAVKRIRLKLAAPSGEELLVAWLNELVYLVSAKRWLPVALRVKSRAPTELEAEITGGPMDAEAAKRQARASVAVEVKAATFGGLRLTREGGLLRAKIILDV